MALKLLLDEDSQGKILIELLRRARFDVTTVNDAGLRSASDHEILGYAIKYERVVLTHNCIDFVELGMAHQKKGKNHPGIFLVYKDNHKLKDISAVRIVEAIQNVQKAGLKLTNQTIVLNQYLY